MIDLDKVDIRTVHRQLRKGLLTQADYEQYLSSLPDLEGSSEFVDYESRFAREAAEEQAQRREEEAAAAAEAREVRAPAAGAPPPPATATALAPEPPRAYTSDDEDTGDSDFE